MKRKRKSFAGLGEVTKKDFVAIAKILCETGADAPITRRLSQYFASQNPNFSQDRFLKAAHCGRVGGMSLRGRR